MGIITFGDAWMTLPIEVNIRPIDVSEHNNFIEFAIDIVNEEKNISSIIRMRGNFGEYKNPGKKLIEELQVCLQPTLKLMINEYYRALNYL